MALRSRSWSSTIPWCSSDRRPIKITQRRAAQSQQSANHRSRGGLVRRRKLDTLRAARIGSGLGKIIVTANRERIDVVSTNDRGRGRDPGGRGMLEKQSSYRQVEAGSKRP